MKLKLTREQLENAARMAALRVDNARRRFNIVRDELEEALQDAAVSLERLRFSDAVRQVGGESKGRARAK